MISFKNVSIAAAACALSVVPLHAQAWAKTKLDLSPRHGEYVTISEPSGRQLQAWVVYPETKAKAPVVVMIHEIFGLSDWVRLMADETAAKGYIVVTPDLLSGLGPAAGTAPMADMPNMPEHNHDMPSPTGAAFASATPGGTSAFPDQATVVKAISNLNAAQVLTDLDAAADYGKHLPAANGKLASAGFCWGGGKSFAFATHRADLNEAFVFYGTPPASAEMSRINAKVYGFYGEMDNRVDATVPQATTDMKAAGKTYEPVTYTGAGHGFMRAGQDPAGKPEDKKAFEEGFSRMEKELRKLQ